jgi:hypothetical protein
MSERVAANSGVAAVAANLAQRWALSRQLVGLAGIPPSTVRNGLGLRRQASRCFRGYWASPSGRRQSLKPTNTVSAAWFRNALLAECSPHQSDEGGHAEPGKQVFEAAAVVRIVLHNVALQQEARDLGEEVGGIRPLAAAATVRAPVRGVIARLPIGVYELAVLVALELHFWFR